MSRLTHLWPHRICPASNFLPLTLARGSIKFAAFFFPLDPLKLVFAHKSPPPPVVRARRSPVAMDVMFELFDDELLITDNAFHHVANRNYTD